MASTLGTIPVRVIVLDPPFDPALGILFGMQDRSGAVDGTPAVETTGFDTVVEIVDGDPIDFRGEHVHGKRGERFIYLSWGTSDGTEPFAMFARAKIRFADIPEELIRPGEPGVLVCEMTSTSAAGGPASGTIKPPLLEWRRER